MFYTVRKKEYLTYKSLERFMVIPNWPIKDKVPKPK